MPSSRGAYPYGGIDLARLYDGRQDVAAGIGGRPPASFGLLVRDVSGRRVFASQLPDRGRLRLTQAPHGVARERLRVDRAARTPGPFQDLRAAGIARGGGWLARTSHRFTSFFVQTTWTLRRAGARGRASADVLFPSWGSGAGVTLVLRDGATRRLGTVRVPLRQIAYLRVDERARRLRGAPAARARAARPCTCCTRARRARRRSPARRSRSSSCARAARAAPRFSARYAPVERERAAETAARLARLSWCRPRPADPCARPRRRARADQRRGGSTRTSFPRFSTCAIAHAFSICEYVYRTGLWRVSMWTPGICMMKE